MIDIPEKLLSTAHTAMQNAYAPYSFFKVGAALLCNDGYIFSGCNVENSSYGLTICAERAAFFSAVANKHTGFTAILIIADSDILPYPCGACRQVMAEFCNPDFKIFVVANKNRNIAEVQTLASLFPKSFTLQDSHQNQ